MAFGWSVLFCVLVEHVRKPFILYEGQLPSQQEEGSMPTMARSALSSTGYVSQWLWRYMEHGVGRLNTLSSRLATRLAVPRSEALSCIYTRIPLTLVEPMQGVSFINIVTI